MTTPQASPAPPHADIKQPRRLPRGGSCPRCSATTSQAVPHECETDARTTRWLKTVSAVGGVFLLTTLTAPTAAVLAIGVWLVQRRLARRRLEKPLRPRKEKTIKALESQRMQHPAARGAAAAARKLAEQLNVTGSVSVIEPQTHGVDIRARRVAGNHTTLEMSDRVMMLTPAERSAMIARELAKVSPEGDKREKGIAAWSRRRGPAAVVGSASMAALAAPGLPVIAAGAGLWGACSFMRRRARQKQLQRSDEVGYQTGGDSYLGALERLARPTSSA